MTTHRFTAAAAVLLAMSAIAAYAQSGDPFLNALARDGSLDRPRLARFMGRVSASLERGREGVGILVVAVEAGAPGKPYAERASEEVSQRFDRYTKALSRFSTATVALRRNPDSELRLFRVLASGSQACWLLESQINLAESYGANPGRLQEVRSSGSACATFHHVVERAGLADVIETALTGERDEADYRRENKALKEELRALERLLDDLQEIDSE